jgi:hypothetical protein
VIFLVGTGKTTLCLDVVKNAEEYCQGHPGQEECFFFFSSQGSSRMSLEPLQRSLIAQFCTAKSIIEPLQSAHLECRNIYATRKPSKSELKHLLSETLRSLSEAVLILKGTLDEAAFEDREEVTTFLDVLAGPRLPRIHLFVTRRNEPGIEQTLSYPILWLEKAMEEEAVNANIEIYASRFLKRNWHTLIWSRTYGPR